MEIHRRFLIKPENLLGTAGFLVMLLAGIHGKLFFSAGLVLYFAGLAVMLWRKNSADFIDFAFLNIVFFLFNLLWYSSIELFTGIDVSLAVYSVLIISQGVMAWRHIKNQPRGRPRFPYAVYLAIYLAAIFLSLWHSQHSKEVFYFAGLNILAAVFAYATYNIFRGGFTAVLKIFRALILTGLVSAILAVWQLYSGSFKTIFYPYIAARDQGILELWEVVSRVVGTWQHPSYLGIYLALVMPLAVYILFYQSKTFWEKTLWSGSLIFMGAVLLLTNTRSSVLAGALGVLAVFIFPFLFPGKRAKISFSRKFALLGMILAVSMILYQFVFVVEIYTKPQAWRVDASATIWGRFLRSDSMSTESLIQRSQLYRLAWDRFKREPMTGMGAKNFPYAVEEKFGQGTDAHDIFLQIAAEMGIVGLLAFVLLFGKIIISQMRKILRFESEKRYALFVCSCLVLLVLFDSLFNNPLFSLRIVGVFWLIIVLFEIVAESDVNKISPGTLY